MDCKKPVAERLKIFHSGNDCKAYEFFGCHRVEGGEEGLCVFRVWAPHAKRVMLCITGKEGEKTLLMQPLFDGESYEITAKASSGDTYNYLIETFDNRTLTKADPFAFRFAYPDFTKSVVYDLETPAAYPELFTPQRSDIPVNIYEVNLLSWKRHEDNSYYTFRELARELVPYVKKMGYTHVEFMPVTEYPFDGSWGYQVTGYFAITSRLGTPEDFKNLVDEFHKNGIKVIVDWVPAHFPKDGWALYEFDGQPLYECPLWDRMEHKGWGTRRFDFGRGEVDSFLISSACFLFDKYRIDGMRVDAVASIIYLDYDRNAGDFTPNEEGGNLNFEGIAFIKKLNRILKENFVGAITIAEESTAFPKVTGAVSDGGLGFDYKWNMGWMNDVLFYCRQDPYFRSHHHNKMTFALVYAFSEKFILPLSHDEVVHVKGSIVNKMPGDYPAKFAGERLLLAFMYAHPGKKLNFMGYEVAQFSEWNYNKGIEFFLADKFELHAKMKVFAQALNKLYKTSPPLYKIDDGWQGFEWLVVDDNYNNFFAFSRNFEDQSIVALFNFSGVDIKGYEVGINEGRYRVILNTDDIKFGGNGTVKKRLFNTVKQTCGCKEFSIKVDIPKLTCMYLIKEN